MEYAQVHWRFFKIKILRRYHNTYSLRSRFVCSVKDVDSGRRMECHSNQPGFQFYPGKFDIIYVEVGESIIFDTLDIEF